MLYSKRKRLVLLPTVQAPLIILSLKQLIQMINNQVTKSKPRKPKVSILFWKRRHEKFRKGHYMIYCRITIGGERAVFSTQIAISKREWYSKWQKILDNEHDNSYLAQIKADLENLWYQLSRESKNITAKALRDRYVHTRDIRPETVLECYDRLLFKLQLTVGKSTMKALKTKRNNLKEFFEQSYHRQDLQLTEIKPAITFDMLSYFKGQKGHEHNTVVKAVSILKRVLNYAYENGWIQRNPLSLTRLRFERPKPIIHLPEFQLQVLENHTFASPTLSKVRDFFVFSCYTGLAYVDLRNLNSNHLINGVDGQRWIDLSRQKSAIRCLIPLLPPALDILKKYAVKPGNMRDAKLLPLISNQKYNFYLKEIAAILGFTQNLTTHVARKTCATMLLNNGMQLETVSAILGHTNTRITASRYSQILEHKISEDVAKFRERKKMLGNNGSNLTA